jgi:ribonuclease R
MTKNKSNKTLSDPFAKREAGNYENPIASRELILEQLEGCDQPLTHLDLVDELNLSTEEQVEALRRRLIAMCRDGQLIENRRKQYLPMSRIELIRGRIQGHKDGYGFLIPETGGTDYHLNPKQMRKVFDGDIVAIRESGVDNRGKQEAVIVEVIQRNTHQLVGRFYTQGDSGYVVPDSRRITQEIMVQGANMGKAQNGEFVVVEVITQPGARQLAMGKIKEVLGEHLAPGMEIDIALRSHEIPFVFGDDVLEQAKNISAEVQEADKKHRVDLRQFPLVTIDGEDARDFDDAVYASFNPETKGYTLYVAIADVSHYVEVNSPLDVEAQNRGNSVYFPEHVVPMLPEKLSNGLCSLMPHVDRLCMVSEMEIDAHGELTGYNYYEGVMHSHARLTYNLVGKILDSENEDAQEEREQLREEYKEVVPHLDALHGLYQILRKARSLRGAIEFESVETRIIFNADRKIEDIVPVHRNDAHKVIEECMLCANVATAKFFQLHNIPALYRVHQGPSDQKLENLKKYLNEIGIVLNGGNKPTPKDYLAVMLEIQDRPDVALIQTMLLRSMSQAVYQPDNEGHFGLAYPAYTHFTSPIRRYPDLLVHRAIRSVIRSERNDPAVLNTVLRTDGVLPMKKEHIYPYDMAALLQLGEQSSLTERRADDATRDVMDFLKCEYMRSHVGDTFAGVVSTVTNFGIFVSLKDLYIEGLIHVTNLTADFYQFDPVHMRLKGERTGRTFKMGDEVEVIVSRVDLDDKKIDFQLAENALSEADHSGKPARSGPKRKPRGDRAPRKRSASNGSDSVERSRATKKKIMDGAKNSDNPDGTSNGPNNSDNPAKRKKKPSTRQKLNNRKKAVKKKTGKKK